MGNLEKIIEGIASGYTTILRFKSEGGTKGDISFDGTNFNYDNTIKVNTISESTSASGVTIDGVLLKDSQVAAANLTTSLGANATPVARTNNPVVGANTPNVNIDVLDAAIGVDHTPVTRTTGQTAVTNTVNANIDALDAAIGYDAQMSGTGKNANKALSVFQNLDLLDTYKSVQTIKKTIGGVGVAACDFNFATAENQNEQVIDLGAIIPARSRVIDVYLITEDVFTGAVSLVADVGNASGGAQFIASATIYADDAVLAQAVGGAFTVAPAVAASNVFVNATPGANWSAVTAGKVSVYVTFINVANI